MLAGSENLQGDQEIRRKHGEKRRKNGRGGDLLISL